MILVLMVLMLASGVLAMEGPIRVQAQPGDWVKVYAWTAGSGPLLNMGDGIADENGTFETTFFSLNVPDVRFNVFVIRDGEKIRDVDFLGHSISEPLSVDCRNVGCEKIDVVVEETVGVNEREIVVIDSEAVAVGNDSDVVVEEGDNESFGGVFLTAMAIFVDDDGSLSWGYLMSGFVVLIAFFIFLFLMFHGRTGQKGLVVDDDEKELEDVEKRVKDTEDKIKSVKGKKVRLEKIRDAKVKLADEEKELRELEEVGDNAEVEKQKDVVEKAEDKVDVAEGD